MSGLEQEFPGKVRAHNVDATTPESEAAIQGLGFQMHGLVIRSSKGDVLWKEPDHDVRIEHVRAALKNLIKTG